MAGAHLSSQVIRDAQPSFELLFQQLHPHRLVLRVPCELDPLGVDTLGALRDLVQLRLELLDLSVLMRQCDKHPNGNGNGNGIGIGIGSETEPKRPR